MPKFRARGYGLAQENSMVVGRGLSQINVAGSDHGVAQGDGFVVRNQSFTDEK
jgi:hypothetical protein